MDNYFKCDCGTHIVQIGYTGAVKDFDWEEIFIGIYSVYNDKGDRRLKNPKLLADVVLFNNASPKELDDFFNFMERIIKNRKKSKRTVKREKSSFMKFLDISIKNIKIKNKKDLEKENKKIAKKK